MEGVVKLAACNFLRNTGPGGTDLETLQEWLLKSRDNRKNRISVESPVYWLAKYSQPWDVYQECVSGKIIALDTQPGVCPVGVRETWN